MNIPATATKQRVCGYDSNPDYRIDFLAAPGRVRVLFNGVTVADSGRAMEMREGRYPNLSGSRVMIWSRYWFHWIHVSKVGTTNGRLRRWFWAGP